MLHGLYVPETAFPSPTQISQQHPQPAKYGGEPPGVREPAAPTVAAKVEECERLFRAARRVVGEHGTAGDGVDVREADVVAVEAVRLVDLGDPRVVGLDEGDVDTLYRRYSQRSLRLSFACCPRDSAIERG
jgi:hypothetical protein